MKKELQFIKVLGFMEYEVASQLEVGSIYKGKKNNYKVISVNENNIILQAVNGHDKTDFGCYATFLERV